jgi:hypothetical protein
MAKFPSSEGYGFSRGVGLVTLTVYDIMGREVQTLVNKLLQTETYVAMLYGTMLTRGVYFYKMQVRHGGSSTGDFSSVKKMILVK